MKWTDLEDIAEGLMESHPETDPLTVRFTQLLEWVGQLPEFDDDIHTSNEKKLEAVQMAWYELWQEEHS
jgi:FeS assembly protein IscX